MSRLPEAANASLSDGVLPRREVLQIHVASCHRVVAIGDGAPEGQDYLDVDLYARVVAGAQCLVNRCGNREPLRFRSGRVKGI